MLHAKRAAGVVALVCASLAVPAAADAARVHVGSTGDDTINGGPRRDVIFARAGNDVVHGALKFDRIYGGLGNDQLLGDEGHDLIAGGRGDDTVSGGPGRDRLFGNLGADTLMGGDGNDRIWALAIRDVAEPGVDHILGEGGNDHIRTRDGEPDLISCGDGYDRAQLDTVDVIEDASPENLNGSCEVVIRKAPNRTDTTTEDQQEDPPET